MIKRGALEFEKIVSIILIVLVIIILIVFAKTRFDAIKEFILGIKLK